MGLSRGELFARIGLLDEVDPLVNEAYEFYEWLEQQQSDQGADHDDPWHVSFHGSQFPGDNSHACGRQQIYRLMDVPRGAFSRRSRQLMDQGKDMEVRLVDKFWRSGMLLSAPPLPDVHQTQFEDSDVMLTSTVDSIVLPRRSNKPIVVEIKQIGADTLEDMIRLVFDAHPQYTRQVRCQIGFANEAGQQKVKRCFNTGRLAICLDPEQKGPWICPQHGHPDCLVDAIVEPPDHGYLYYVSRDEPIKTRSFYFEHDPKFMAEGRRQLARWRDEWLAGTLPQTNFEDKRFSHPFGWTWTRSQKMPDSPCEWCDYGEICRADHKKAVSQGGNIRLVESAAIEDSKRYRPDYDYEAIRAAQLARWGLKDRAQQAA